MNPYDAVVCRFAAGGNAGIQPPQRKSSQDMTATAGIVGSTGKCRAHIGNVS